MGEDLVWSIKNGDLDQVRLIIEKNIFDVNEDINGRRPIHYAADFGQANVLQYLITLGADVNKLDKHGIAPLLAAVWEGHTDCVKILVEHGASKEGTTPDGKPYIEVAEKEEIRTILK